MTVKALKLEELSVEQKLGQLLVARSIASKDDFDFAMQLIKNHALGGVQVSVSEKGIKEHIKPVLDTADYPIFIAADMEQGFQLGDLMIAGNLALGAMGDEKTAYMFAKATAKQAKKAGFNMIWSPVVDSADHDSPNKITRCLGADYNEIAGIASAYMKAFAECGVVGSAKHFPSCDEGEMDSHMAPPICHQTKDELISTGIYTYKKILNTIGDDMTGIMVGHSDCVEIDGEYPASLSKKMIDLIRDEGFDGLMITDSLAMVGVLQRFGDDRVLGLAVAAGNDLLLPNYRISLRKSYNYLLDCFNAGMFSEERLNEAVARVLKAQERTIRVPDEPDVTEEERRVVESIDRNGICAVLDEGVDAAVDRDAHHLFCIDRPNVYINDESGDINEISSATWWNAKSVAARVKELFPNSEVRFFSEFPSTGEVEKICYNSTRADDVVFLTFCDGRCYQGTDGLTERARIMMEAVKPQTVAHCGNPYAMEKIVHVPRLIMGFQSEKSVENVLDVLAGKLKPSGSIPLPLKLK